MPQDYKKTITRTNSNVRQLETANGDNHQNQILSALDTLGAKLVRSESERETMRRLLNEALEAQDRLETQLERSSIDISRRIDLMERDDGSTNKGLSDEDRQSFEDKFQIINDNQDTLQDQQKRQRKVEDKLRDSQQIIAKLQRRLDSQEQKRMKLQRRVERVENIAADAQNALEAKAMVLLTNQSERLTGMHNINAESPMQILNDLHHHDDIPVTSAPKTPWHKTIFMISASWVTVIMALALGWFMATSMQLKNNQAMPTVTPLTSTPQPFASIENDIASVASDLITMDILEQAIAQSNDANNDDTVAAFDVIETVTSDAITMDRDLSLPADLKSLEDSAFDNIAEAQHDLAALYVAGQGDVTQNFERAGFWFKRAASQGIGNAAYNLGVLNQQGLGQPQNVQRALDWYRRAAQLGHPEAQYNLGIAYIEGIGTRYNPSIAAAFFQKAAFAGIVEAAYNIGLILENGLLGEVRTDDALKWYRGAAENGNTDAQKAFEVLVNSMKITQAEAGLLENGGTLSQFLKPGVKSAMMFQNAREDISLGTLVPTDQQILVSQIQEQLRKVRLYNGPQDGIVGAGTVKAIQSYQRQNNIPIDGKITDDLLSFMILQGTL